MEEARVLETLKVIGFNPSNPDRSVYHRRLFLAQEAGVYLGLSFWWYGTNIRSTDLSMVMMLKGKTVPECPSGILTNREIEILKQVNKLESDVQYLTEQGKEVLSRLTAGIYFYRYGHTQATLEDCMRKTKWSSLHVQIPLLASKAKSLLQAS